jgi:hypothetical protein
LSLNHPALLSPQIRFIADHLPSLDQFADHALLVAG